MGSKINHSWFLPSRVAIHGGTDTFTANYKIRMNVIKCHGWGKDFDKWKWGMGRVLGDTKSLSRGTKENLEKSTVKAAVRNKSVINVLVTQLKFICEFLKVGIIFNLSSLMVKMLISQWPVQAASV